jgi:LPXTG-site transpeptidase (sortase) family protein
MTNQSFHGPFVNGSKAVIFDAAKQGYNLWYQEKSEFNVRKKFNLIRPAMAITKPIGLGLMAMALTLLLIFLTPLIQTDIKKNEQKGFRPIVAKAITPTTQENFLITISKLGISGIEVIKNVDLYNEAEYTKALKKSVAHAKQSGFPGGGKMVYIFGHSTSFSWFVNEVNALFYKIETLEPGDEVKLTYNAKDYVYQVSEKLIIEEDDIQSVAQYKDQEVLVLQSCWPPGTSLKRIIIIAKPKIFPEAEILTV